MNIKQKIRNWYLAYKDAQITQYLKKGQYQLTHSPERLKHVGTFDLTKEQKKSIDNFFLSNYGAKIDYTCHRTYTAFGGGKFDVAFLPEELYIPEVERYMNMFHNYCDVLQDKNITPFLSSYIGIKSPVTIFSCTKGLCCDSDFEILSKEQLLKKLKSLSEFFCKPSVESGGGFGCMLVRPQGDNDSISGNTISAIINDLGDNYVIQKCIHCHDSILNIYPNSVNTFRVMTYRWKNEIKIASVIMRIGVGGMLVDNASSGGIFCGINRDGTLFPFAINEYGKKFEFHPDTKVFFKDCKISHFEKVLQAALKAHKAIPQIGVANWDFTLDEDADVILIETNLEFGSPWLFQMVNGCSVFGKDTAEILRWTNKIKHTPISERHKFAFGNNM